MITFKDEWDKNGTSQKLRYKYIMLWDVKVELHLTLPGLILCCSVLNKFFFVN